MPFSDGKHYMNPAYGRAVQRSRAAEAASEHDELGQQQPGTHWVTIEGHHVLIHETQGGRTPHGNQSQPGVPVRGFNSPPAKASEDLRSSSSTRPAA